MFKKKITKEERLQLVGLTTLAIQARKRMDEYEGAIKGIIGEDELGMAGLFGDAFFDDSFNIDTLLKDSGIKVK